MSDVIFEVADGIATITINRPEVRNAVNAAVALAIADATDQIDQRDDIQAAILTGAGGRPHKRRQDCGGGDGPGCCPLQRGNGAGNRQNRSSLARRFTCDVQ